MTTTRGFEKNDCAEEEMTAWLPSVRLRQSNESAATRTRGQRIRTGPRHCLNQVVWLTSLAEHGKMETVVTQNVSHLGARAIGRNWWEPGEVVLISCPPGFSAHARIVYCQKLPSEDFILGFRLVDAHRDWITSLKDRE